MQFGPDSVSYQPGPAARLVFTQSQPLPATTATQLSPVSLHGGDAHRPVMAQNRIVGEFFWKYRGGNRTESLKE